MRLYVETLIDTDMDTVWRYTQEPSRHARWDARFHRIHYLPGTAPQRFRYVTCGVAGDGVSVGERERADGGRTSALRFASDHAVSPIRSGSGYWRYVPTGRGIRFLTGYDYEPGWGRGMDRVVRPLMGWLTAWSFDRLRLWLERGISPVRSRNQALAECAVRVTLVFAVTAIVGTASTAGIASAAGITSAIATGIAAAVVPPLPSTPAARRCRRTRPDATASCAPSTLDRLESP